VDHQLYHVRVSDGRRVVLPAEVCKQLGIDVGDTVIVDVTEGKVQLHSFDTTLAGFRALLASKVPPGVSLVDELLAERRAEAERE
jgi:AbrB family looped-hinge helix DNA binding protein